MLGRRKSVTFDDNVRVCEISANPSSSSAPTTTQAGTQQVPNQFPVPSPSTFTGAFTTPTTPAVSGMASLNNSQAAGASFSVRSELPLLGNTAAPNPGVSASSTSQPATSTSTPASSGATGSAVSGTTPMADSTTAGSSTTAIAGPSTMPQHNQSSAQPQKNNMTFGQLQDYLNKYLMDLQEQEQLFGEELKRVNEVDKILNANGAKITSLQSTVDGLKKDHVRVGNDLKYLQAQQLELEYLLGHIEGSLSDRMPTQTEPERLQLFNTATGINNELQQIGTDLKFIIENINECNSLGKSENRPIVQMMRIMNEHTDALLWIEQKCSEMKSALPKISEQHASVEKDFRTIERHRQH